MNNQTPHNRRASDRVVQPDLSPVLKAQSPEELAEIGRFWYAVYVEEMGKNFSQADHAAKTLADDLSTFSTVLYVRGKEGVVGTVRVTSGESAPLPQKERELYGLHRFANFAEKSFSFTSRLIVHKDYRGGPLVGSLIMESFRHFLDSGHRFSFAYCTPSLVQLYEQLGMRRYKENYYDDQVGLRIPMVLVVGDHDHYRSVRSPFSRLCKGRNPDREAVEWFRDNIPVVASLAPARLRREQDLWRFFQARLHQEDIPLFKGLSPEEVTRFLKAGTVLPVSAGQPVVKRGEAGNEMFLILSGVAEVSFDSNGKRLLLANLGKGDIFGEMAFVSQMQRSADVTAVSDVELMIINQKFLDKLVKIAPELAARVMINLSMVLCQRLHATTLGWVESTDLLSFKVREHGP